MDIQELVRAQRAYFLSGATRPYAFRMEQLKKLQRALQTNEKLLEQAMYQDFRKAPMEVYMCETGMVLEELRFHLKHLKGWMRERAVPTPLAQFHAKSFVSPEPYGVALIISPWNYPVQLCLSPLVGAISDGNEDLDGAQAVETNLLERGLGLHLDIVKTGGLADNVANALEGLLICHGSSPLVVP